MVCDTSSSQDASTHQIWDSYLKLYKRYAPDTIILKTRSEVKVKVTVTRKWYATLSHPKMHPQTKFGIPSSKNIGDMDRTQKRDGQTDSAITICLPKILWGHKNQQRTQKHENFPSMQRIYFITQIRPDGLPDLNPNCVILLWHTWKNYLKIFILKKISRWQKNIKNFPSCKEFTVSPRSGQMYCLIWIQTVWHSNGMPERIIWRY